MSKELSVNPGISYLPVNFNAARKLANSKADSVIIRTGAKVASVVVFALEAIKNIFAMILNLPIAALNGLSRLIAKPQQKALDDNTTSGLKTEDLNSSILIGKGKEEEQEITSPLKGENNVSSPKEEEKEITSPLKGENNVSSPKEEEKELSTPNSGSDTNSEVSDDESIPGTPRSDTEESEVTAQPGRLRSAYNAFTGFVERNKGLIGSAAAGLATAGAVAWKTSSLGGQTLACGTTLTGSAYVPTLVANAANTAFSYLPTCGTAVALGAAPLAGVVVTSMVNAALRQMTQKA